MYKVWEWVCGVWYEGLYEGMVRGFDMRTLHVTFDMGVWYEDILREFGIGIVIV